MCSGWILGFGSVLVVVRALPGVWQCVLNGYQGISMVLVVVRLSHRVY